MNTISTVNNIVTMYNIIFNDLFFRLCINSIIPTNIPHNMIITETSFIQFKNV